MEQTLIRNIVGGDEEYLRDESKKTGYAETVSFPETEEQVRSIFGLLNDSECGVTVQGNRTGLAAGAVPFGGHIMNLSRMDKVVGMRCEDGKFYVRVQPGVILQKLNKAIAARSFDTTDWDEGSKEVYAEFCKAPKQMFTPDPTETSASIGGMAACNASGAKSYRYGATRAHVNALRCVTSEGQTLALKRGEKYADGRRLRLIMEQGGVIEALLPEYKMPDCKNASGYFCKDNMDLLDLLIGSDGTLAVITELELGLVKEPKLIWGVTGFFATEKQAVEYTRLAKNKKEGVAAIEYFDACALDILREQKASSNAFAGLPAIEDDYGCAVYIELHRETEDEIYSDLAELGEFCESAGGDKLKTWVACNESDRNLLHFFRHAVPESVNMLVERYKRIYPEITKIGGDLAVPDDRFEELLQLYDETLREAGLHHAAWGHIGNNHIHVNILPRDMDQYVLGKTLLRRWAEEVSKMKGAVSAEHGVGKLKSEFLELMYGKEHISSMRELKKAFDPKYRLGRGNLFDLEAKGEVK